MDDLHLVGVLLSTNKVRVSVYDIEGVLLRSGVAEISEQTTSEWERALREATPGLADTAICSVAGTSGTVVLANRYGEPVFPPQMYYESSPEWARELQSTVGEDGDQQWDIALSPTAPLPKIAELKEEHPTRFENVEWILSPATWLLYRLCHGYSEPWRDIETDWTNALKFGADIRPSMPRWYDELFNCIDISKSLLPTIRPPGSFVSVGSGELASRSGFEGLRLFQGMTDGEAYVLANDCIEPGDFSVTFGETSVVKYVSESIKPNESLYYHRHPVEGYLPGASFDSGNVLQWFSEHVLNRDVERSLEIASSVRPGEEAHVYLPGNRGPFHDPDFGLSIFGLDYDMSLSEEEIQGRLAGGIATGIILAEGGYLSLVEDHFGTEIDDVRVMNTGGSSLDNYEWNRMRSSIWNRQVTEMEARTTAGLLIPAALITSVYDDINEATVALLREQARVDPDPEVHSEFEHMEEGFFDQWKRIATFYEDKSVDEGVFE